MEEQTVYEVKKLDPKVVKTLKIVGIVLVAVAVVGTIAVVAHRAGNAQSLGILEEAVQVATQQ